MPIPIICLDTAFANFAAHFRHLLSKPQYQYFVTVLMGLVMCQQTRTLSGLVRTTAHAVSLSGLSRFLSEAPWSAQEMAQVWLTRFCERLLPMVNTEHERLRQIASSGPKKRGRPTKTVVIGYLIGDDSTVSKPKGRKMDGLGVHYSTTARKPIVGHSLVQALYVLLGCRCPLPPQMYRQKSVCEAAGCPFQSKIDMMVECIRSFEPVPATLTYVLLDSWYCAKAIWTVVRHRGFHIVCGIKSNRKLKTADKGWQTLSEYAAALQTDDYQIMDWPRQYRLPSEQKNEQKTDPKNGQQTDPKQPRQVYVHVVKTRVRKLYCCQVMVVRERLDGPLSEVRYFATSDMNADPQAFINHVAARWDIEVLFGDTKELLGLDQYQVMSDTAILRFWTLIMATYAYLDEVRVQLQQEQGRHVTIGDACRETRNKHYEHQIDWIVAQSKQGVTCQQLYERMAV